MCPPRSPEAHSEPPVVAEFSLAARELVPDNPLDPCSKQVSGIDEDCDVVHRDVRTQEGREAPAGAPY